MDKTEYWFLNLVVRARWAMDALLKGNPYAVGNRPVDYDSVLANLQRLFERGDLIAESVVQSVYEEEPPLFVPTTAQIENALKAEDFVTGTLDDNALFYGLTEQGGARWEAVSRPDWNRYLEWRMGLKVITIQSANPDRIKMCLTAPEFQDRDIQSSVTWEELVPWEATYWKTLPRGYQVSLPGTAMGKAVETVVPKQDIATQIEEHEQAMQQWRQWRAWFQEASKWCIDPWTGEPTSPP